MSESKNRGSSGNWLTPFINQIIRYRIIYLLLSVAVCVAISTGQSKVGFSSDYHYYFGSPSPVIKAMEELESTYAQSDSIYIAVSSKSGESVFTHQTLEAIEAITEEAWKIPYATRVDSLTNFQHTRADGDDLHVDYLVEGAARLTQEEISYIRNVALNEPVLKNRIISPDGKHTGINIILSLPGESPMETPTAVTAARSIATRMQEKYDIQVHLSGVHMMNNAFGEIGMQDITKIMPIMYLVMLVILLVLFRSVLQVLMTVAIVHLSTITSMGLVGWLGIPLTAPSSIAPTIILTLAVADSVHVIMSFVIAVRRGETKADAIKESLQVNFKPIFLTSITTIIGFLALNFADAPPYHDLGNITAMGVAIAFVLSITLLPALLMILPNWIKVEPMAQEQARIWPKISQKVSQWRSQIIMGFAFLTVAMALPIPSLVLDDRWVEYFSTDTQFRQDADFVQQNLTGLYSIEFNLPSKGANGISDPEYLAHLEKFADFYRQQDKVYNVSVLSDVMKRLNKNLHNDEAEFYRLPEEKNLSAQYLLLYEMSLPYGLDLTNQINMDKSKTKLVVTMKDVSTVELREFAEAGEQWLKENAPDYMHAIGSGATVIFAHQSDVNIQGMIKGTALSLAMICVVVFLAMRNVRYGLISVLPNVLPAVFAFGAWTLLVGQAGMEVSIVVSATLGVIVDNCVHFMVKYLKARDELGFSPDESVLYAYQNVGSALIFTSVTLLAGYLVLTLSSFSLNSSLGLMSAMTVAAALLVINLLLPAIILTLDKQEDEVSDMDNLDLGKA